MIPTVKIMALRGLVALAAILVLGASAARAGDAVKGNALAKKFCARCHVIGEDNPFGGIGSSPSFPLMAKYEDMYRPRIRTFQERRPHAQFQWDVSSRDIEDLETYIMSLPVK